MRDVMALATNKKPADSNDAHITKNVLLETNRNEQKKDISPKLTEWKKRNKIGLKRLNY